MKRFIILFLTTLCGLVRAQQPIPPPATQQQVNSGTATFPYVSPATLFGWTGNTNPPGAFTNGQPVISAGAFIGNGAGLTNLNVAGSTNGATPLAAGPGITITPTGGTNVVSVTSGMFATPAQVAQATNGLGSAAFYSTNTFDENGAAHAALLSGMNYTIGSVNSAITQITNNQSVISAGSFIGDGSGLTNLTITPSSSYVSSVNGTATNLNVFGNFNFLYNSNTNSYFAYSSVTNCLVAWWPFNGNMHDVWGGNDCYGGVYTYTANGESMQALVGTGVGAMTPSNPAFDLIITTNWTFSCWVCLTNSSSTVSFVSSPGFVFWNFYYGGNVFDLRGQAKSCWTCGSDDLLFPAALPLNQWVHVAIVCNLYSATVYTNGVALSPQFTGGPWTVETQNQIQINSTAYGIGTGYYLDECAWFTNCLSSAEVASIYYAGANSLNMGAPLVYTNNGFVIGLTGVSLPTGQTYYGDGSGLTNLNAGGGAPLAAGPGITITPTGGTNVVSVTSGTFATPAQVAQATNGLGGAAFYSTNTFDLAGAAQAAFQAGSNYSYTVSLAEFHAAVSQITNGQPVISAGSFIGDGSGLTNLNAGGGTNGGAPLAAGPGITITPTGGSNTLSVTPGTYDPFGAAAAAQSASDPAGTATAAVRAATNTLAAAALAGNVPAASLGNIAAGANVTITTNGGQVVIGATGGGSGGVALWTSAGGFIFPNGNTGTNNGWISTGPTLYPQ